MAFSLVQVVRYALKREFGKEFWTYLSIFIAVLAVLLFISPVERVVSG